MPVHTTAKSRARTELAFDYEVIAPTFEDVDAINREADECLPQFYEEVGTVWAYQRLLSPTEKEEMRPLVLACMAEAGHPDLPNDASVEVVVRAIKHDENVSEDEQKCLEQFSGYFSTWKNPDDDTHGHE
jgi:hypothetical protein